MKEDHSTRLARNPEPTVGSLHRRRLALLGESRMCLAWLAPFRVTRPRPQSSHSKRAPADFRALRRIGAPRRFQDSHRLFGDRTAIGEVRLVGFEVSRRDTGDKPQFEAPVGPARLPLLRSAGRHIAAPRSPSVQCAGVECAVPRRSYTRWARASSFPVARSGARPRSRGRIQAHHTAPARARAARTAQRVSCPACSRRARNELPAFDTQTRQQQQPLAFSRLSARGQVLRHAAKTRLREAT